MFEPFNAMNISFKLVKLTNFRQSTYIDFTFKIMTKKDCLALWLYFHFM